MFLDFKKTRDLKKTDKKEVDVTLAYYPLADDKIRFVFFFYDPTERKPIHKWAYYLLNNNYKDLKSKYREVLKENNFKPNRLATLCMCNKTTKINSVRLPKTLKYTMKYKTIIKDDLVDKMGSDYKSVYFVDNKIEGEEEKKAERKEKRVMAEASRRKASVDRYKKRIADAEYEYKYERNLENRSSLVGLDLYLFCCPTLLGGFGLALGLLISLGFKQPYIIWPIIGILAILLGILGLKIFLLVKKMKNPEKKREKFIFTYKHLVDIYYILVSTAFLILSEILAYNLYLDRVSENLRNFYGIFVFLYALSIAILERAKRKHLSKLCVQIKRKPKEKKMTVYQVEEDEDEEELFEGGMNENKLFNMSKSKVKIKKSKKARSVIIYRQLLVPKDAYKAASKTLSVLGLGIKTLRTLPSLIASFHRRYSKGVNEIVAYNEAGFTLLVGFVNDAIIDSVFIEGHERTKIGENNIIGLHLSSFRNVFSSLLWACQRETSNMDRVVYISNTEKNIEEFKKENLFGLPYEVVPSTDIVFGESARKVKSMALFRAAFTLIETVVAVAIFASTMSLVATLALGINKFNRNMSDSAKANEYVNNICEVINGDQEDATFRAITTYVFDESEYSVVEGTYCVDLDFSVFNPSRSERGMAYKVEFKMEKVKFPMSGYSQDYIRYSFLLKKITRINEKRDLISPVKLEVVR